MCQKRRFAVVLLAATVGSVCRAQEPDAHRDDKKRKLLLVIPAPSITDLRNAPALAPREKFELFWRGTLDPFPVAIAAVQGGVSQARDRFPEYGQGFEGYMKRFGAAYADSATARLFGTFVFPSLLRHDPRYFRKGEGSFGSRFAYSLSRVVICRTDSGKTTVNASNLLGKFTGGAISNLYYPEPDRGLSLTLSRVGINVILQLAGVWFQEFGPDIDRKLIRRGRKVKDPVTPAAPSDSQTALPVTPAPQQ